MVILTSDGLRKHEASSGTVMRQKYANDKIRSDHRLMKTMTTGRVHKVLSTPYHTMPPVRTQDYVRDLSHKDSSNLTPYERVILVGMRLDGTSFQLIHNLTGVSTSTAHKYAKAESEATKENPYQGKDIHKRCGRPRKTTEVEDEKMFDQVAEDPSQPYAELDPNTVDGRPLSTRTIERRLARIGIRKWMSRCRFLLDEIRARADWEKVIFSDETTIQRGSGISRSRR
ncbi:hypothetical protein K440DRAFT_636267 [Wilcoxina mikolae CBS 423.85]|nr:hypothetical protein K440DRAFT_636267 [Wilcoxina mikolae CBS 423.85]